MSLICVCTIHVAAKRSNVLRRRYAKRSKENSFSQEVIGHLTKEVHEALNIPYMSLVAKVTCCYQWCFDLILLYAE